MNPAIVLGGYAASLLDGRRVAVFGDATSSLPEELVERGARVVNVYDPVAARAAEAATRNRSSQVSVLSLEGSDIAVRDGAFDVAIIPDLASLEAPAKLLKRVRRALSPRGTAIVLSPNPEARFALIPRKTGVRQALGYYDLFDLVSAEFPEVRMLGQTPFVGYAVVDFAPEGEPDVSLDSELVPGGAEEPEWFVAVASAAPVDVEAFSIVQLPAARVVSAGSNEKTLEELRAARENEARLVQRAAELEAKLEANRTELEAKLEAKRAELEAKLEAKRAELEAKLEAKRVEKKPEPVPPKAAGPSERERALEQEIRERDARIAELTGRVESAGARADAALAEVQSLTDAQKRAVALESARAELARRLDEVTKEKAELSTKLTELAAAKERADRKLAQREADVERLTNAASAEGPDDVARLELALKERGERVRALEADLREAERVGKELVRELGSSSRGAPSAGNGNLSEENARLRADVEAMGWAIQELEGRLLRSGGAAR